MAMQQTIRILLADDHAVVRDGLKSIIERAGDHIQVVGEADTGREVLRLARTAPIDLFVLDLEMPEYDGIETANRLQSDHGPVKVVFLSMYDEKILVERAVRAGARGYLLKDSAGEEIVRAIEEVYRGNYYFSPKIAGYLAQDLFRAREESPSETLHTQLTDRQVEILKRICNGMTEKEIAYHLNISPNTVHVHVNNIMKKVSIHNKAGLIKYAIKMGIVRL
ncbi:MAG: response regulator transcription factor [Spirochaetales bacterium]|nr:response regulator transcription factor [Spirochaetales bacterium]